MDVNERKKKLDAAEKRIKEIRYKLRRLDIAYYKWVERAERHKKELAKELIVQQNDQFLDKLLSVPVKHNDTLKQHNGRKFR